MALTFNNPDLPPYQPAEAGPTRDFPVARNPAWAPLAAAVRASGVADLVDVLAVYHPNDGRLTGALVRVRFRQGATPADRIRLRLADLLGVFFAELAPGWPLSVEATARLMGGDQATARVSIG